MCTCMRVSSLVGNRFAIYWSPLRTLRAPLSHSYPFAVESLNGLEVLSVTWAPHADHSDEGVHTMQRMAWIQCHLSFRGELTSRQGHLRPAVSRQIHQSSLRLGDSIRIRCSSGVHPASNFGSGISYDECQLPTIIGPEMIRHSECKRPCETLRDRIRIPFRRSRLPITTLSFLISASDRYIQHGGGTSQKGGPVSTRDRHIAHH